MDPHRTSTGDASDRYRAMVDALDIALCLIERLPLRPDGRRDYRYLAMNRAMQTMFGVRDLTGETIRDNFPNEVEDWYDDYDRVLDTGVPLRVERESAPQGIVLEMSVTRLDAGDGPCLLVGMQDVTRRRRAQDALADSVTARERTDTDLAFLAEVTQDLAHLTNISETMNALGEKIGKYLDLSLCVFVEVDEAAETVVINHGWHRPDVPMLSGRYRIGDYASADFQRASRAGEPWVIRDVFSDPRTDGERLKRDLDIGSMAMMPLVRDHVWRFSIGSYHDEPHEWRADEIALLEELTARIWTRLERARAEEALSASEAKFRVLFDSLDDGFCIIEFLDGPHGPLSDYVHVEANPAYTTNAGIPDIVGKKVREMVPDEAEGWVQIYRNVLLTGERVRFERELVATGRYLELAAFRIEPPERRQVAVLFKDITDRKRAQDAVRANEEQLIEADRRKDEFLAMLAHELRNPLAPIRTGLELIRVAGNTPAAVERVRSMMDRQVNHMVRLIDDLLDVSRISSGKIQLQIAPTPVTTLVNSAVEANRAAMNTKHLALTVDLPKRLSVLDVDPTRFIQVVSNLLHNATKFTPAGGTIRVTGSIEQTGRGVSTFALSVADSGIGMSAELLPRVFDLFTQGDSAGSQPGLGIGLALARRLVEMQGGEIEARSAGLGAGSEFIIRLPLSADSATVRTDDASGGGLVDCRVLVIDDNEDGAAVMAMLVEALGGECRVAYDGDTGVQEALSYRPDVVMLDIGMPGIDGYETCRRIRGVLGSDVVIVAITGFAQRRDKDRATEAGFDAHLTKPADPGALEKLLRECRTLNRT